jgi:hypothetical protein
MNGMRRPVLWTIVASAAMLSGWSARAQRTSAGRPVIDKSGWTQLWNGKNLAGWEHVGPGKFVVEDGMLKSEGGMGLLWYTRRKFGNCVIRVVYKTTKKTDNSGVFIRIPAAATEPWMPVNKGYEVQIDDSGDDYHVSGVL